MHWMDRAQARLLKPNTCFVEGWGDLPDLAELAAHLRAPGPPPILDVDLGDKTVVLGADLRIGSYTSPNEVLPGESRTGRVWWLHPADQPARAAVIMMAAWGDEGPTLRGRIVGPLVREGVAVLIPENPFYGVRRREGQRAGGLRTVSDFVHMQATAFDEARGLIAWSQRTLGVPVALAGFSMGAHLASAVAAVSSSALPLAVMAPPLCPSEPFTEGPLSKAVAWHVLGEDAEARWRDAMDLFDLRTLPRHRDPERTRFIGCRHDGFVPPAHTEAVAAHWDARIDWVDIGHVGGSLFRSAAMRQALREVLGLPQPGRRTLLSMASELASSRT